MKNYYEYKELKRAELGKLAEKFGLFSLFGMDQTKEEKAAAAGVNLDEIILVLDLAAYVKIENLDIVEEKIFELENVYIELLNDDDFLYSAFYYELANHEYCINEDAGDALETLGLTRDQIENSPRMMKIFRKATKDYMEAVEAIWQ